MLSAAEYCCITEVENVDPKLVGNVIRQLRLSRGMSQEVLSGLAGLDRTHYSKIERGQRLPTLESLWKIAHALNIPPHQIVLELERQISRQENVMSL